jgi:hypothetical protein
MDSIARPVWTPRNVAERNVGSRDLQATRPTAAASARAAVAVYADAGDAQLLVRRQQLERKRVLDPVLVDDRRDLRLHVVAYLLHDRQFFGREI